MLCARMLDLSSGEVRGLRAAGGNSQLLHCGLVRLLGWEPTGLQAALAGSSVWLACGGHCLHSPVLTLLLVMVGDDDDGEIPSFEAAFSRFR